MAMHFVGVDEAGRGPLAGPVAVGVVALPHDFDWERIPRVTDSKKLSEGKRDAIYRRAYALRRDGTLNFRVAMVGPATIDRIGISEAVRTGIGRAFEALMLDPQSTHCKLDGLLAAPPAFTSQETIVKGDLTEPVIGLASILAKVTRDRYMVRQGVRYPTYDFAIHKGYGTKAHRTAITEQGLSPLHRRSFCKNIRVSNTVV